VAARRQLARDEDDRLKLSTASALADIHAKAIRRQVSLSDAPDRGR
jgi:hypothetical protein